MRGQARKIHCHLCSIISRALLLAIFALAPRTAPAQGTNLGSALPFWEARERLRAESPYRSLSWRCVGPSVMSARIIDVEVSPADKHTIYLAGATSGIWKTVNSGITWNPIFDDQPDYSIGDVAIAPTDPDIIWVGTGEANFRQNVDSGFGIYKSEDGGKSWRHMGLTESRHIGRIIVHPRDPRIVYVAVVGALRSANDERGIFKTTDGGKTWRNVKYIDEHTGFVDMILDPQHPDTLYAASYYRYSGPWFFYDKSARNGIWKTDDGARSWTRLTNGLPVDDYTGRIGISLSAAHPKVIYARLARDKLGENGKPLGGEYFKGEEIYRSDDGGESWRMTAQFNQMKNPWYFAHIIADPKDPDKVISLGGGEGSFLISTDGGKSFTNHDKGTYGDHQALWIDPDDTDRYIAGHDGGASYSYDGGKNWRRDLELPIGQIYAVSYDMRAPYWIHVGTQDSHSLMGPSNSVPEGKNWKFLLWGDGMNTEVDPVEWNIVYPTAIRGTIERHDLLTRETISIAPSPRRGQLFDPPLRFSWNMPSMLSPHDRRRLYLGANKLLRSSDRGDTWEVVSPDLTTQHETQYEQSSYSNITAIAESPLEEGLLYVGTDDGLVWRSPDNGVTWLEISTGLPKERWATTVSASPHDKATVYVNFTGDRLDDFAPYVFKSKDHGKTWMSIVSNLPQEPTNVIHEDPRRKDLLYVGTERGIYVSFDGGESWASLVNNLPTVPVVDLTIHPRENDLIIATYGRSVWVLNVGPLQELTDWVRTSGLHLFPNRPYYISADPYWGERYVDYRDTIYFTYYLGEEQSETVIEIISERDGTKITELKGSGSRGLNQVMWNRSTGKEGRGAMWAPPGRYRIQVSAGAFRTKGVLAIRP